MFEALAICAFIFALLAFIMATGTLVYVLARRFSTVETRQVPVVTPDLETRYELETPPEWSETDAVGGPEPTLKTRPPVSMSSSEHDRMVRMQQLEDAFEARVSNDYGDF